jgi:hypothetical protein
MRTLYSASIIAALSASAAPPLLLLLLLPLPGDAQLSDATPKSESSAAHIFIGVGRTFRIGAANAKVKHEFDAKTVFVKAIALAAYERTSSQFRRA